MKKRVWLSQVNNLFGNQAFLPYSVGLLQAYAQTFPEIRDAYEFCGFVYLRENIEDCVRRMGKVDVFGASCYIWNFRYSMALARAVKVANPQCLIVAGGPHVPTDTRGFFEKCPVDIAVHFEGEETFTDVLLENLNSHPDFSAIPGTTAWISGAGEFKGPRRERTTELDKIPSPYLTGVFDPILAGREWLPMQELDRGCPYSCTFCDWGSSVFQKVRRFSEGRLIDELDWFSRNKTDLLYNASANFGMTDKDVELTRQMVETKKRTGYPRKFRAAYAKNSGARVYEISRMLHEAGMNKGVTLSFQSMDQGTLEAVKRKNIGIQVYSDLMKRYRREGIATYSEIIIGLPGETYESFANGLDTLLNAGAHDSISCYLCEMLPNSEMSAPEYRDKYGIKSVEVPVLHFHAEPPEEDPALEEKYELVISTNTLPPEDWLKCCRLAWIVQCGHCLGLTQKIAVFCKAHLGIPYRSFYEQLLRFADRNPGILLGQVTQEVTRLFEGIPHGRAWGMVDERFGKVTWPPEEGAFLKLVAEWEKLYWNLRNFVGENLLGGENWSLAGDLITYQREILNLPDHSPQIYPVFGFGEDVHSVIEGGYEGESRELKLGVPYRFVRDKACPSSSLEDYARTIVWHGRKGGSMFHKVEKVQ